MSRTDTHTFHMDFQFEGMQWSRDVDARDFTQAAAIIAADYEGSELNLSRSLRHLRNVLGTARLNRSPSCSAC